MSPRVARPADSLAGTVVHRRSAPEEAGTGPVRPVPRRPRRPLSPAEVVLSETAAPTLDHTPDGDTPDCGHLRLLTASEPPADSLVLPRRDGRTVLFLGCHGGCGSTTLATSVGVSLARSGLQTAILDLDLQFGNVLTALDLQPSFSLTDVLALLDAEDEQAMLARLPRHRDGLFVLSQVGDIDGLVRLSSKRLGAMIPKLRRHFDVLIVDGARDFHENTLAVLDEVAEVLLVLTEDVPAVRGLAARLGVLDRLGFDQTRRRIVLNRHQSSSRVKPRVLVEALGVCAHYLVANDFPVVHRCLDEGRTLFEVARRARVTRDVEKMTADLFGCSRGAGRGRRR